ncbi:hypothetical protein LMH73_024515 [Vibrio splendidus]|nr:hypothetical protein [Vibrio splendidus]MCC4880843.1 hypothetical protein [Vibrio splendidus]
MKKNILVTMSLLTVDKNFQRSISHDVLNIESICIHPSRADGKLIIKCADGYGYMHDNGLFIKKVFLVPRYLVEKGYEPTDFGNMFLADSESRSYSKGLIERLKNKIESALINTEGEGADLLHDTRSAALEIVAQYATSKQVKEFREKNIREINHAN